MAKFNASETWWYREREREQVPEMLEFANRLLCSPEFINNCQDLIVFMSIIIIIIIIIISIIIIIIIIITIRQLKHIGL